MSNSLAIGAVTATLRNLLSTGISPEGGGVVVTTLPPDKAQIFGQGDGPGRINLFLYQTQLNAAWRNTDIPRQVKPSEAGQPPLAVDLYYLLTAHEKADGDATVLAHRLLGRAMRVLHDHPLLGGDELRGALTDNDLASQIERIRITPQPLSLDELSKLWMIFQTGYRISAGYQVSVVLIDSKRAKKLPLPVLQRGKDDQGATAGAGISLPIIEEVRLPNRQSSALLGDELSIVGENLNGLKGARFALSNPRRPDSKPFLLTPPAVQLTDQGIKVTLPSDAPARRSWMAGFYRVAVVVERNGQSWSSNELPISLAPGIDKIDPGNVVARDAGGNVTLTLTCSPEVPLAVEGAKMRFDQQAVLLLGTARQLLPEPPPPPPVPPAVPPVSTSQLKFVFPVAAEEIGDYLVRLRVDGVDLPLVDRTVIPPQFDKKQKVTIK
jgi:hypothetical protein